MERRDPVNIGYARVSTADQNLQLQKDALRKANCDTIREEVKSGKADVERPVRDAILRELERGDTLTVWKLDRLGRSIRELDAIVRDLGQRGVKFKSVTETIDTSTPQGKLFFWLLSAFAEFERAQLIERTKAGRAARIANGLHPGGPRSYGFEKDRETVIPAEAKRLEEAASHARAGGSLGRLVDEWNRAGVAAMSGGKWHETTLRRMLENPRLVPLVLDQDTHDALVRLYAPAKARQRLGAPAVHLLSGILICGACGTPMYFNLHTVERGVTMPVYMCRKAYGGRWRGCGRVSIACHVAEPFIAAAVKDAACGPHLPEVITARRAALLGDDATAEQLDAWRTEIEELETVLGTRFATEEHRARHAGLTGNLRRAQARLIAQPELQELMDLPRTEGAFTAMWEGADVAERRRVVKLLLRSVTVKPTGRGGRFTPDRLVPDWKI